MDADFFKTLRQCILLKTGLPVVTSRDCKWIAAEIRHTLNRHISVTTIKRVFGFAKTKYQFSKYTIAILKEYTDEFLYLNCSYIKVSKSPPIMDILSFITDDRSCIAELNENEPCLHPEQLVITAIKIMLERNLSSLAICENGKCIGRVYTDELKRFINCGDQEDQLIYYRLNFDLQTAIAVMKREAD